MLLIVYHYRFLVIIVYRFGSCLRLSEAWSSTYYYKSSPIVLSKWEWMRYQYSKDISWAYAKLIHFFRCYVELEVNEIAQTNTKVLNLSVCLSNLNHLLLFRYSDTSIRLLSALVGHYQWQRHLWHLLDIFISIRPFIPMDLYVLRFGVCLKCEDM